MAKLYYLKSSFILLAILGAGDLCRAQNGAFNVVGNAVQDSGSCFQLTTVADDQASAVWYNTPVDIHQGFDLKFHVFLGNFNPNNPSNQGCGPGADGMCFILQNSNTGIYNDGGGLGYEGFPNQSLGIELDTYQNGWDPPYHHIAIETNGSVEHPYGTLAGPLQMSATEMYAADGNWHTFEIIWNPHTDSIATYFDSVFRVGYNFDSLGGLFNGVFQGIDSNIYWGFTGSTGDFCNLTQFCVDSLCLNATSLNLGSDTTYCSSFARVLTSGTGPVIWSTGDTASQITITQPGIYWAAINTCAGPVSDTVHILQSHVGLEPDSLNTSCGLNNGSIAVTPDSGFAPYHYHWNTGAAGDSINGLAPGNYQVTVTDNFGCTATASASISSTGPSLGLLISPTNATCGQSNGSVGVTPTSGSAPFTYRWSNGDTTATLSNLEPGAYAVTVADNSGCSATISTSLSSTQGTVSVQTNAVMPSCASNGSISTSVTGGAAPFNYLWNNGVTNSSPAGLASGAYTLTVTDSLGCSATLSATVDSVNTNPVIAAERNAICPGDTTSICAPAGYTNYNWSDGQTGNCIVVNEAGNYYVTVSSGSDCVFSSNHIAIQVLLPPSVSVSVANDTVIEYGGVGWQWYLNGQAIAGATDSMYLAKQGGIYSVDVTDANSCVSTSNVFVVQATGIENLQDAQGLNIYPDPAANTLNVSYVLNQAGHISISITDVLGQQVSIVLNAGQQAGSYLQQIDLGSQAAGTYILNFISDKGSISRRFVKGK